MLDTLRRVKRRLLTGGFAETVYFFLTELEKEGGIFRYPENEFLVNLSFDFELGFGTTFWENNIEKSLSYGRVARKNFVPIMQYLNREKIPANVQIVGALLDGDASSLPIFNQTHRDVMSRKKNLFRVTEEDINLLNSPNIEAGIHGFSHRHFTSISAEDARFEMQNAVSNFEKNFGRKLEFMAFPKNCVGHTDIVRQYGIKFWRSDNQHPLSEFEIPLGHWFAPGVLGRDDLKKLLSLIKSKRRGFLLNLWGHFTEMDARTFKELVEAIRESGWKFTTVKNFKKY